MIQLIIDGKPAIPKKDISFKISYENMFFTKTSTHSFEIELPLAINENIEIFGSINRIDIKGKQISFPALLYCDNKLILSGSAKVTHIDESFVKIQLLGESASFKYGNIGDKLYIDELPLRDWYSRMFGSYPGQPTEYTGSSYIIATTILRSLLLDNQYDIWKSYLFNQYWVAYPIYNTNADTICNQYIIRQHDKDRFEWAFTTPNDKLHNGFPQVKIAIQPFIWYMCQLIAEATGYNLKLEDNDILQNDFFRRIFIANANINVECNKCLPHWTVNEWWEQIEKTFGVNFIVSDFDKSIKLKKREYKNFKLDYIYDVVDEFTVQINETQFHDDIFTQNVDYSDGVNYSSTHRVPSDLFDCCIIKKFDTIQELQNYLSSTKDKIILSTIFECENRHFVVTDNYLLYEINMFRSRIISQNKEIDIKLKFVPCKYASKSVRVCSLERYDSGYYSDKQTSTKDCTILSRPDKDNFSWLLNENDLTGYNNFILWDILMGNEDYSIKDDKQDLVYIALHAPIEDETYPKAWIRERLLFASSYFSTWSEPHFEQQGYSLSLIPIKGQRNFASETLNDNILKIDTSIKYCFKFISDKILDTSNIFVIRNKKYICEKLEVSINNNGFDKLMTGYFYSLD